MKRLIIFVAIGFFIGLIAGGTCHPMGCAADSDMWHRSDSGNGTGWTNPENAYDGLLSTYASSTGTDYITFNWSALNCSSIAIYMSASSTSDSVDVEVYYSGSWHVIQNGTLTFYPSTHFYVEIPLFSVYVVSSMRVKFSMGTNRIYEAWLWGNYYGSGGGSCDLTGYATEAELTGNVSYLQAEIDAKASSAMVAETYWPILGGQAWVLSKNYTTAENVSAWADANGVVMGGIEMPLWFILIFLGVIALAVFAKSLIAYIGLIFGCVLGFALAMRLSTITDDVIKYLIAAVMMILAGFAIVQILTKVKHF
jgi:hypothetical protein